ncbi:ArsR family transcriptional regulator, partial [Bacteroides ovatus]
REMVSHSLAFRKNSKLARSIRKLAIERGGTKVGGNPEKKESDEK